MTPWLIGIKLSFNQVLITQSLITLNQAFIRKILGKLSSKTFPVGTRSKTSLLTTRHLADCSGHPADWWSNQKLFNHYHHAKII